jgi:hypothetical protein
MTVPNSLVAAAVPIVLASDDYQGEDASGFVEAILAAAFAALPDCEEVRIAIIGMNSRNTLAALARMAESAQPNDGRGMSE